MFLTWKRLIALQGQNYNFTKTLIWKYQMIEQKICDPLVKILLILDLYFERYAWLKIMSRLMAHEMTGTLKFLTDTDLAHPMSRPMSRPPRHESTHESTSAVFRSNLQNLGFLIVFWCFSTEVDPWAWVDPWVDPYDGNAPQRLVFNPF